MASTSGASGCFLELHCPTFKAYEGGQFFLGDFGVFWDFASLPQVGPDGKRTQEDDATFRKGLTGINLVYGAETTTVIMLTRMPPEGSVDLNLTPYEERGWCTCEHAMSSVLKPMWHLADLGRVYDDLHSPRCPSIDGSFSGRRPPIHPDDMDSLIRVKTFTNGSDAELVAGIYRSFFARVCSATKRIRWVDVSGCPWGREDAKQIARVLPSFTACEQLILLGHEFGDEGLVALSEGLAEMPSLRALWLAHAPTSDGWAWTPTVFGEAGLQAITEQLPRLHLLHTLLLRRGLQQTEAGQALEAAWTEHGKPRGSKVTWPRRGRTDFEPGLYWL